MEPETRVMLVLASIGCASSSISHGHPIATALDTIHTLTAAPQSYIPLHHTQLSAQVLHDGGLEHRGLHILLLSAFLEPALGIFPSTSA